LNIIVIIDKLYKQIKKIEIITYKNFYLFL